MINADDEVSLAYLLDPCFELVNTAGKPLTDGYIEVYLHGTRNKYYCYSDWSGTLHPFQIPLDSLGSNIVLANPDNAYDVYVYNRFGNLIMSRYNVTPADGGAVISNTERINELEETLVSAVTGLQDQIDDINEALDGKKDKQEPYSVTLTPTQTVSAIIQNENGEMEVIYQEIDLPEEVPNVDIVSPASTLNITTHIDEETNTKTFSIDISDLGHLEYGQYMATEDVITGANMYRIKGNLNTTLDGKIQLHKGNSYHITVRGSYVCTDINNSVNTLDYIEYSTFTPFHVDVDNTITDPQNFEISYDIFKLSNDTNYYIAFAASAGKVSNLTVEIHSLSNLSILDPDFEYQEGWGINIVSSVISVDPTIFNDYTTHTDVYESIVTAIDFVTGAMPAGQIQSDWDETDESSPAYIQNKPDLDIYATHDEVNTVSGQIIETVNNVSSVLHEEITNNNDTVIDTINNVSGILHEEIIETAQVITGLIPDVSDFTTHEDVNCAIVTAIEYVTGIIPDAQVQSDWEQSDDTQPDYIKNKPDLDIYATHDEVNTVSGQIIEVVNNVSGDIIETVNNVSGDIIETVNNVSGILHGEIENIPAQQQADWNQSDDTQVDYIKNKPDLSIYATHDEVVSAVSSIDLSDYATHTEVYDSSVTAIQLVTGLIPDVSDFTTHDEVHESIVSALEYVTGIIPDAQVQSDWTETDTTDPAYIKHKPNQTELVAGQNIGIFDNGSTLTIAASGTDLSDYTTFEDVIEIVSGVTGLAEYGQFYATAVSGAAVMARTKGTIDVTNDGKIKLTKGSSYHVTVRGRYNQTTPNNAYGSIAYIEYITNNSININVDKSITDSQFFEISYDLYKLNSDSDYYVFFTNLEGTVNDLFIEIHALGGIGGNGGSVTGATEYDAGWGIQILNNVISVDPSIFNDYVTADDLVSAIQSVVTAIPASQVQSDWTETDTSDPSYIQNKPEDINLIAGTNIGIMVSGNDLVISASGNDLSDYATLEQLQDSVELVTGLIPTIQLNGSDQVIAINNYPIYSEGGGGGGTTYTAGDGIDITNNIISVDNTVALKTDIPEEEEVEFEEINLGDYALVSAIPDVTNYATHTEVNNVSGAIVNLIPELPEDLNLVAGQNIGITISGNDIVISASGSDMSDYVTEEELIEAVTAVTAAIPAAQVQSDWDETNVSSPAYIQNKPDQVRLVAGQNITIVDDTDIVTISASVPSVTGFATKEELHDGLELVTGLIPDVSNLATKTELNAVETEVQAVSAAIPELPEEEEVEFEEIDLTDYALASAIPTVQLNSNDQVTAINNYEIAGTGGGTEYTAGNGIDITNDVISVDDTVALVSALPTTELGKFTIQNNVTGGPIEVICPTDQGFPIETVILDNNDVSGSTGSGTSQVFIVYKSPGYDDDWYSTEGAAILHIPEAVSGLYSLQLVYAPNSNPASTDGPPFISQYIYSGTSDYVLAAGDYDLTIIANQVPQSPGGYGKYITLSASGPTPDVQALLKSRVSLTVRHPELGITVDLDRYYLGNNSTITNTSGYTEANIYTDPSTKKQSVFLPSSMPYNWKTSVISMIKYGATNIPSTSITSYNGAYKQITGGWNPEYQFGVCTYVNSASNSRIATYLSYNKSTGEIEKWTLNWNSSPYTWTTETISSGSTYTAGQYVSIDSNDVISVTGLAPVSGASGIVVEDSIVSLDNPIGLVAGDNITIEVSGVSAIISSTESGGGSTYSAGNGIDITNDVISIDNTVALKSDIPVVTGFATKTELATVEAEIPTLPAEEEVDFEEIDLSNYAMVSAIPDVSNLATKAELQVVSAAIPDTTDMATQTWVGNQGYLTSVPANYVTDSELNAAVSGFATQQYVQNYTLSKTAINTNFAEIDDALDTKATKTEVTTEITEAVSGKQDMLTGITDVQVVTGLPASPTQDVLYLIVEA